MVFDGERYGIGLTGYDNHYFRDAYSFITRVGRTPATSTPVTIALGSSSPSTSPSLVARGDGRIAFAYSRIVDAAPFSGASRIFVAEETSQRRRAARSR